MRSVNPQQTAAATAISALRSKLLAARFGGMSQLMAGADATDRAEGVRGARTTGARHEPRYRLIDLGTFGGPTSGESTLNWSGEPTAVGWASTAFAQNSQSNRFICGGSDSIVQFGITHAFRWREGQVVDLGSLAGQKFCSINAQALPTSRSWAVGQSEINKLDPALGFNQSRAVLWRDDNRTVDLGSFGGGQNAAFDINESDEVTGFSLNTVPDQYSIFDDAFFGSPNGTQTRAFLWRHGQMRDLGTLGTGNDVWGFYINQHGQITGIAYTNATPNSTTGVPTVDPFFWDDGKMVDLGSLGGVFAFANAMNDHGVVVGYSDLAGDTTHHGFVWEGGKMIDVGTAGGNFGEAWAVNNAGEVVGFTTIAGDLNYRAFIWKNGHRTDLAPLPGDCGSQAWGIDSRGRAIGNSMSCPRKPGPLPCEACFFEKVVIWDNGTTIDVSDLVARGSPLVIRAVGPLSFAGPGVVNARGEIAGWGVPAGVRRSQWGLKGHALILVPIEGRR